MRTSPYPPVLVAFVSIQYRPRPAETSLLTVLDAGENEVLAHLRFISDPVLVIVRDVGQYKYVGNTLGVIPDLSITSEVADLIDRHSAIVTANM